MNTAFSRIRLEIGQEQYGFFKDTGTRNAIFMIRIPERAIQIQKDIYLCMKAFDMAQRPI